MDVPDISQSFESFTTLAMRVSSLLDGANLLFQILTVHSVCYPILTLLQAPWLEQKRVPSKQ